jgi:hypothetical protein
MGFEKATIMLERSYPIVFLSSVGLSSPASVQVGASSSDIADF